MQSSIPPTPASRSLNGDRVIIWAMRVSRSAVRRSVVIGEHHRVGRFGGYRTLDLLRGRYGVPMVAFRRGPRSEAAGAILAQRHRCRRRIARRQSSPCNGNTHYGSRASGPLASEPDVRAGTRADFDTEREPSARCLRRSSLDEQGRGAGHREPTSAGGGWDLQLDAVRVHPTLWDRYPSTPGHR